MKQNTVYMRKRRQENKEYALSQLGNKCRKCGSNKDLQFDHKNPSDKTTEISCMLSYSRTRLDEELKKCQLLCKECHIAKTRSDFGYVDGAQLIKIICAYCGKEQYKPYRDVGNKMRYGQKAFYCNRTCMGLDMFVKKRAYRPRRDMNDIPCGDSNKYTRGCRCDLCRIAHNDSVREWRHKTKRQAGKVT